MFSFKIKSISDFPGSPVVKTLCSQCRRHGFNPWLGNKNPICHVAQPKKIKQILKKKKSVLTPGSSNASPRPEAEEWSAQRHSQQCKVRKHTNAHPEQNHWLCCWLKEGGLCFVFTNLQVSKIVLRRKRYRMISAV